MSTRDTCPTVASAGQCGHRRTQRSRTRRQGPLRRLRRQARPRGADGGDRGGHRRVREGAVRSGVPRRTRPPATGLHRPALAAVRGDPDERARRGSAAVPQARGSQPHRLAQDQQRARAGVACQADGQDPHHRRDRRRPARRRDRDRVRAARPRMHRLHGRSRHRAPGSQRRPDAPARRAGGVGGVGVADPQGRDQRGPARLGDQRPQHLLLLRHRGGPAPVPGARARLPTRHRTRGPRADPGPPPAACPTP